MKITASNFTFTGYSNVFAMNTSIGNSNHMVLAMQLNDDETNKDLTKFRELKKMLGIYTDEFINNDILVLKYSENKKLGLSIIDIDNNVLMNGEELLQAEKAIKSTRPNLFEEIKRFHLKMYTLLASLTKRLSSENHLITNKAGLDVVKQNIYYNFLQQYKDAGIAASLTLTSLAEEKSPQPIAKLFNTKLVNSISSLF